MKKLVLMFVALFTMSASVFADGLTATLQQGDVMTPFYGVNAFQEAYAAAQDGAVITLSSGKFNDVSTVSKQITVIGAFAFDATSTETTFLGSITVATHNVKFEGIYFTGTVTLGTSSLSNITNCTLKRCWVETSLTGSYKHDNTLVDQCVIKKENAMSKSSNYCIKNSTIGYFAGMNTTTNLAYITNCVVWEFVHYYYNKGYIQNTTYQCPYAFYKNNYLGIYKTETSSQTISFTSPSEFYNNMFCQTYMRQDYQDSEPYSYLNSITLNFASGCVNDGNIKGDQKFKNFFEYPAHPVDAPIGSDGTAVGPYGGTGFSEYPAIPRIISKTIDSNSDAEGKINVKITVKAEK
jgi:hypothetical protein